MSSSDVRPEPNVVSSETSVFREVSIDGSEKPKRKTVVGRVLDVVNRRPRGDSQESSERRPASMDSRSGGSGSPRNTSKQPIFGVFAQSQEAKEAKQMEKMKRELLELKEEQDRVEKERQQLEMELSLITMAATQSEGVSAATNPNFGKKR